MSEQVIRALLETRLSDWADDNDLPIAWEEDPFTPPKGSYLKFNLLPAQTRSDDLQGKLRTWTGIAQIAIFVASGNGPDGAGEILKQLDALFPCNLLLPSDPARDGVALNVLVLTPMSAPAGRTDKAHYMRPAFFQYRTDLIQL